MQVILRRSVTFNVKDTFLGSVPGKGNTNTDYTALCSLVFLMTSEFGSDGFLRIAGSRTYQLLFRRSLLFPRKIRTWVYPVTNIHVAITNECVVAIAIWFTLYT